MCKSTCSVTRWCRGHRMWILILCTGMIAWKLLLSHENSSDISLRKYIYGILSSSSNGNRPEDCVVVSPSLVKMVGVPTSINFNIGWLKYKDYKNDSFLFVVIISTLLELLIIAKVRVLAFGSGKSFLCCILTNLLMWTFCIFAGFDTRGI